MTRQDVYHLHQKDGLIPALAAVLHAIEVKAEACQDCGGTGRSWWHQAPCGMCDGHGETVDASALLPAVRGALLEVEYAKHAKEAR